MPATNQQDGTIPPTTTLSTPRLPKPPVLGQVCYVYESIATPIELIFLRTHAIQARPDLVQQCQEALDRIHAAGSKIGKVRPCIVMRPAISGLRAETVCLKGTFGGADPASMGKVYKHFVRGIFPNRGLPGSRHMHLVPEGRQEKSWVIAFEFETMRPIADTWSKAAQAGGYHGGLHKRGPRRRGAEPQHLEKISQAILRDECETSFDAWQAECQDHPETAVESLEEHRVSGFAIDAQTTSLSDNCPETTASR
ncbi:hypothetical protein C8T65DRAFT_579910 [Cerioporus squamosus]|nr:hypothetical protein C8T65DRAFT_579910 [Cerioporus squamosus]